MTTPIINGYVSILSKFGRGTPQELEARGIRIRTILEAAESVVAGGLSATSKTVSDDDLQAIAAAINLPKGECAHAIRKFWHWRMGGLRIVDKDGNPVRR
ncbi:MAG: hypothetical protein JNG89_02805 [Planctomycetaceae bacterium]|nr:hypothetical protein [Planctomycetaceae bacterium]